MPRRVNWGAVSGVLLVALCACGAKKGGSEPVSNVVDSLTERDSIPIRQMPDTLEVSATRPLFITGRVYRDSVTIFPYTLIFQSERFNAYIVSFNDFSPTLVTLDTTERIIDSMTLIGKLRPEDTHYLHVKTATIKSPDDIVISDSVFTWDVNEAKKRIPQTKKIVVGTRRYRIGGNGSILENRNP